MEKENRIIDLKKKNQELDKFKFVLDYKIKQLTDKIKPKSEEIEKMKDQITRMDMELEKFHQQNVALDLTIADQKLKLSGLKLEVDEQCKRRTEADGLISRVEADMHSTAAHLGDPKQLKDAVKGLYKRYVTTAQPKPGAGGKKGDEAPSTGKAEQDMQLEYNRQRDYLEKSVDTLKRQLAKDEELHRSESLRITQENVALVRFPTMHLLPRFV